MARRRQIQAPFDAACSEMLIQRQPGWAFATQQQAGLLVAEFDLLACIENNNRRLHFSQNNLPVDRRQMRLRGSVGHEDFLS